MLLPGFIRLSLMLMLATYSNGQNWTITVNSSQQARAGSDITVNCTFTYPESLHTNDIKVTWKKNGKTDTCTKGDPDKQTFIFHPNDTCVDAEYRGRTKIIGDQTKRNCTLQIKNVTKNVLIYMRVYNKDKYSFRKVPVSIAVIDDAAVTPNPNVKTFTGMTTIPSFQTVEVSSGSENLNQETLYVGIFVPAAALVIILIVVGVFVHIKRKRSLTLTREGSGYYANFSRASADIPKKESFSNKQDTTIDEPEAKNEPIYINYEAPTAENNQCEDPTENLYGNVNYLKN
ncbi:uncharacterized protein LOC114477697 [Gouania willdenowi]|uniref:uncharacterized protein LOC114477697 n=1 Tax=Gouania willdenowi TaxID=441366 RepID=UPI001054872B|nr:uncharacterized protein LOC114477697 [Gouania willdenowi]